MKKIQQLFFLVFVSFQASAQWTQVYDAPGNFSNVKVLSSPNDSICWFITNQDTLYKTNDGGATWTKAGTPTFNPSGLFVANNDTAFKLGLSSIYRTTNGGVTWTNVFQATGAEVPTVWMKNDSVGIFSYGGNLHKTTDSGITWSTSTITQPPTNVISSVGKGTICNFRGDSLWVALVGGGVAFSPDYGNTWSVPANTGWTSSSYAHISFDGPLFGLAVTHSNPFVYLTTDGGNNWISSINSLGANEDVIVSGSHCWFIPDPADHFFIKYSADSGTTWVQQLFEQTGFYVLDKSRTGNTLWAGTGNGKVYVYHDIQTGINSGAENNSSYQISPNISSDYFILKSNSKNKDVEFFVTDMAGRIISSEQLKNSENKFGSELKAGNYVVEINENKKNVFTKRIIKQ